jgi:malate dehydrogenase (oxaloacetate-decarboxylating)
MPVMEGKAALFKKFADIDAVPIVLATQDTEEIIATIKNIAPSFAGINLEDISAPRCFEIEERLKKELDMPVFHDDQHGTAIVVLAGLISALKVVGKKKEDIRVVVNGVGAAGVAITKLLGLWGVRDILAVDSRGLICANRDDLNPVKQQLLTQLTDKCGNLRDALAGADVFIGVSQADILGGDDIAQMSEAPIVFAMANPNPEISPDKAKEFGVAVMATGRSDYPNQINNVLVFPGIFRGAFDGGKTAITDDMKLAAATALANIIPEPTADKIIPSAFDEGVMEAVAEAVMD